MSLEIHYGGDQITRLTERSHLVLDTAGRYCRDNIELIYDGGGDAQELTVSLDSIAVRNPPCKTVYKPGDIFDPTGMVVVASYTVGDNTLQDVILDNADLTIEPSVITANTTSVTIAYTPEGVTSAFIADGYLHVVNGGDIEDGYMNLDNANVDIEDDYLIINTKTATQNIQVFNVGATLDETSWDVISQVAQAGVGDVFWNVGDIKEIVLNGQIGAEGYGATFENYHANVFILDFNHEDNGVVDNNIIFGGFMRTYNGSVRPICLTSEDVSTESDGYRRFSMQRFGFSNYGGWKGCDLRYDILGATERPPSGYGDTKTSANIGYNATREAITNPVPGTLMAALPNDLRGVLRLWERYTDNTGGMDGDSEAKVTLTIDAITLLTEYEVFGYRIYANQYERNHQTQMAFYRNGRDHFRYDHRRLPFTSYTWWTASVMAGSNTGFVYTDGDSDGSNAGRRAIDCARVSISKNSFGLVPAFKV